MPRHAASLVLVLVLSLGCNNDHAFNRIESPPEVAIVDPEPMQVIRKGAGPYTFVGTAIDAYDSVETMTLTWRLDGGEPMEATLLGGDQVALELDLEPLSLGEHLIQLHALDSDGDEALAGLTWIVDGAITAPSVQITAPDDGEFFPPASEITFRGEAVDNNTEPDDLHFAWTSSIDGDLIGDISGDGQSVLFVDDLSVGTHRISLYVTDRDGEVGMDSIDISIGETISPAEPGDLVFSELMINPKVVADEIGEWVELYNTAGYAIDLQGYSLHDLDYDEFVFEAPLLVAPHDYVVLCADMNQAINGGIPCDGPFRRESAGGLALGNGTDEVLLSRPDGTVIDEVFYDSSWFTAGIAIGLDPTQISAQNNDDPSMWCNQTTVMTSGGEPGTPGRENDPC